MKLCNMKTLTKLFCIVLIVAMALCTIGCGTPSTPGYSTDVIENGKTYGSGAKEFTYIVVDFIGFVSNRTPTATSVVREDTSATTDIFVLQFRSASYFRDFPATRCSNSNFTFFTTLSSNQDNTVSTFLTVKSRCSSTFQH
mgnify:CR=1 FL=1